MKIEDIKKAIDVAAGKYKDIDPVYQKLITTLAGAGVGTGVGSISLGKDKSGKKRGYLFGVEKGNSRVIGGLAGALAGLHVPTVKKAEVDWKAIKGNVNWDAIKQKIQEAKDWYESRPAEQRALIGAGVGLGGGALIGKLMGRTGTGAVAGALAGAGAGAYWNDIKKAIDAARSSEGISKAVSAVKPVVEDATKKTKDRIDAIAKKLGVTDKNTGTEESAAAKALAATGAVK